MVLQIISLALATIFILSGVYITFVSTYGTFKFKFVLERMQSAAIADTLGVSLVLIGLMFFTGISFATIKLILVVAFMWLTSPVTSYMIVNMELKTIDGDENTKDDNSKPQLKEVEE